MFESLNNYIQKPNSNAEQMSLFWGCVYLTMEGGTNRTEAEITQPYGKLHYETLNMYSLSECFKYKTTDLMQGNQ